MHPSAQYLHGTLTGVAHCISSRLNGGYGNSDKNRGTLGSAEQDCLNLKLDTIVASDGQFIWRVRLLLKRTCLGTSNNQAWSTVTSLQIQPLYIAYIVLLYVVLTTAGQTDLGCLLIVTQFQSRMFMFWVRYQSKMLCSFQVGFRVSCLCPF